MQEAFEMYYDIFKNNPWPMWILDQETLKFLEVNQAAIDLYGYSYDEFLTLSLGDVSIENTTSSLTMSQRKFDSKNSFKHLKKGADVVEVEVSGYSFVQKGRNTVCNVINDITEQNKTQHDLQESETNFRTLAENSNDMIMRFDRSYSHIYANPISEKYLGIKAENLIGKTHEELGFPKEQYDYWDAKIEEVFVTGKSTREVSDHSPENFYFHWDLIPEFDTDGNVYCVLSVTRDISDFVKAKKELEISEAKLKESNDTKDKLFSLIAHDLRGPIGSIEAALNLISEEKDLGEDEKQRFLEQILKASKSANNLLENLLSWATSQLEGVKLRPTLFFITTIIDNNINLLAPNAQKKGIKFTIDVDEELYAYADVNSINMVLRNLISNAIKFTPNNGTIAISVQNNEKYLDIIIADNGVGMNKEVVENLFKSSTFYSSSGTNNEEGFGLGLILCKDFVSHNGGEISVKSVLGEGSEFVFTVPKVNLF